MQNLTPENQYPSLYDSKAIRALLEIAKAEGQDSRSLKWLLILVNAHPKLTAHSRIFENLLVIVETPPILHYQYQHPEVAAQIEKWKALCQWLVLRKSDLAKHQNLADFAYRSPADGSNHVQHPLNRNLRGFTRNSICSCLFNRHESVANYNQLPEIGTAAYQYLCLQAQMLVSYMHSRFGAGKIRVMLQHNGKDECPASPFNPYNACVAIRHFSHRRYSQLILNLKADLPLANFSSHISSVSIPNAVSQGLVDEQAKLYVLYLDKYFNTYAKQLLGQRKKRSRSSVASIKLPRFSGTRTGFIHIGDGIWLEQADEKEEDNDFSYSPIQSVYISSSRDDQEGKLAEASGLAPDEAKTEAIKLFHPDEIGGAMMKAKYAEMAKMMAAQRFAWDFEVLTPSEIQKLWRSINMIITDAASLNEKWNYQTSTQFQCAIIIKVMLLLGQDLETVRNTHFSSGRGTRKDGIYLRPPSNQAIGFWELPSVAPHYRTSLHIGTVKLGRHKGAYILLPDLTSISTDISTYLTRTGRSNDRIFSVEQKTAQHGVESIVNELKESWNLPRRKGRKHQVDPSEQSVRRITQAKIRNALGVRLRHISRDAAVEWITSASSKHRGETRMHYTNLSDEKIITTYTSAVRSFMRDMGEPLKPTRINLPNTNTNSFHGARFVASMESVKRLVANISAQLNIRPVHANRRSVIRYHNVYTFYVWLLQSMFTSYRAVNGPDELMNERWSQFDAEFAGLNDKENAKLADKARLVLIPELLVDQLNKYDHHLSKIERKFGIASCNFARSKFAKIHFFHLNDQGEPEPVTCSWCEEMMAEFDVPLPGNFHRAFLRTELLSRGCDGQTVDAFLGHANSGESPFFRYSSMDYQIWSDQLKPMLSALANELGLLFQPSWIVKK